MPTRWKNPRPTTLDKWLQVVDVWLENGYNGSAAYQAIYPNANKTTAKLAFSKLRQNEDIKEYIKMKRKKAFEDRCIDLDRVTEEMANIAFCEKGDSYVPASVKAKMLESLRKALIEDSQADTKEDKIVIDIEEEDEENED